MATVETGGGGTVTMAYLFAGFAGSLRRKRTIRQRRPLPAIQCPPAVEQDGVHSTEARYTLTPDGYGDLISQHRDSSTHHFHFDMLGTTRALTNAAETVSDTYTMDAWGNSVAASGETTNPYTYIGNLGYMADGAVDGYYVRRRYLRPGDGRWLSRDIVRGELPYAYAGNGPTLGTDPGGLWNIRWGMGARAGAGMGLPGGSQGYGVSLEYVIDGSRVGACFTVEYYTNVFAGGAGWGLQGGIGAPDIPSLRGPGATVGIDLRGGGGQIDLAGPSITRPGVSASSGLRCGHFFGYGGPTYTWCIWYANVPWWLQVLFLCNPGLVWLYLTLGYAGWWPVP